MKEILVQVETPVAVVVIFVVAPQSSQGAEADGVGEEDLGPGIHPHLSSVSF